MNSDPRPLIAGNWKMHGTTNFATQLAQGLADRLNRKSGHRFDMLLCPPAPLLAAVRAEIKGAPALLGGQDCHPEAKGAFTGDISAEMLADAGCSHVIVGHSERRTGYGEKDALVRAKAEAACGAGLVPVICLGETLDEREQGRALEVVTRQLADSVPAGLAAPAIVIAYEPVWAIGTGRTPRMEEIGEMHAALRDSLSRIVRDHAETRILYGGSVKPENARDLLAIANVNGALIGGASLNAADFWDIAEACP